MYVYVSVYVCVCVRVAQTKFQMKPREKEDFLSTELPKQQQQMSS